MYTISEQYEKIIIPMLGTDYMEDLNKELKKDENKDTYTKLWTIKKSYIAFVIIVRFLKKMEQYVFDDDDDDEKSELLKIPFIKHIYEISLTQPDVAPSTKEGTSTGGRSKKSRRQKSKRRRLSKRRSKK